VSDSTRFDNYIGGEWVAGATYSSNINPSDLSDVIGEYAQADVAQVNAAIDAARSAFPAWSTSGIQARSDSLDKVGSEILARREELGTLLAREEGKTLPEAIGEVTRAGNIFKFFAGECLRISGDYIPSVRPGVNVEVTREARGRCRPDHAVELPDCHSGLENRSGAGLRQLCRDQACGPGSGLCLGTG